jgi:hypothetical protein
MIGRRPTFLGLNLQQYREVQRLEKEREKQKEREGGTAGSSNLSSSAAAPSSLPSSAASSAAPTPRGGAGPPISASRSGNAAKQRNSGDKLDPLEGGGGISSAASIDYSENIAATLASDSSASSSSSSLSSMHRSRTSSSSSSHEGVSIKTFSIFLPHSQKSLSLRMRGDATIEELQRAVLEVVEKEVPQGTRLRVLGIPKGDPSLPLSELKLKAPSRLVTMPSPSHIFGRHEPTPTRAYQWLQERVDSSHACVLRDADEDPVSWSDDEQFERRVNLRIKNYKGYIRLAPMDPKKKVLVLDLDFTAMDT